MERVFTRDLGSKFKRGDIRDYPPGTWRQIAVNARMPMDKFSRTTHDAAHATLQGPAR